MISWQMFELKAFFAMNRNLNLLVSYVINYFCVGKLHHLIRHPLFPLLLLAGIELLMLTLCLKLMGPYLSPIVLLFSGLLLGGYFLKFCAHKTFEKDAVAYSKINWWTLLMGGVLGAILFGVFLAKGFAETPYDNVFQSSGSDILPQIKILITRFLHQEFPYQSIRSTEWAFDYDLFPTYLPLTWMPFMLPEWLGLDYRWFAYALLLLSIAYFIYQFATNNLWMSKVLAFLPFLVLMLFLLRESTVFTLTIETLIVAYYLALASSLGTRSTWSSLFFIMCCLLSRYSIVLWVPLFFLVTWMKERPQTSYLALIILVLSVLIIYVWPFLSVDWTIFKQGYDYHSKAAVDLWKIAPWQRPGDPPFMLYQGIGFGWFFYEWVEGSLSEKVQLYQQVHLFLSASSVFMLAVYFYWKRTIIHHRLFLLGALKIYLVIFYNFIQLPFLYLYLVPVFVSLPMIGVAYRLHQTNKVVVETKPGQHFNG